VANDAAASLARQRWAKTTRAERVAAAKQLVAAREEKLATASPREKKAIKAQRSAIARRAAEARWAKK
jgi:hypothetical protein